MHNFFSKKNNLFLKNQSIIIDSIQFGIPESEIRHHLLGGFTDPRGPEESTQINPQEHPCVGKLSHEEVIRWRDVADTFRFELSIPRGAILKNLRLELCLCRYAHRNYKESVRPTVISAATSQRVYHCGEILLPYDNKWHLFTFQLKELSSEKPLSKISFLIDDSNNFRSVDKHYGCSISYAKLFCTNDASISPDNLKTRFHSHSITNQEVILVICPVWDTTLPPISIACIASYLRSKGINPFILDFNIESFQESSHDRRDLWHGLTATRWIDTGFAHNVLRRFSKRIDEVAEEIARSNTRVVAFSIYSTNVYISAVLAERIKKNSPDKTIVFGGPGVLFSASLELLGKGWDYLVIGDGEEPLYNIVTNKKELSKGIVSRAEIVNMDSMSGLMSKRYSEPDLNALPLLDYEGFDLNRYLYWWKIPAYTSRGCFRRCSYCFDWNYYYPYRYLKGEIAYKHLVNLYRKYGRRYFELSDLLCNGNLSSVVKMARMLRKVKKEIKWGGFAVIRSDMEDAFFRDLKAGGCDYLRYGFETACDRLLKGMRRGYTTKIASEILRRTKNAGIRVHINILVGLPGETDDTVEETLNFLRLNAASIDLVETVNTISIMPDTELMKNSDAFGIYQDSETKSWKIQDYGNKNPREWAQEVLDTLEKYGIPCQGGIIEGACEGGI